MKLFFLIAVLLLTLVEPTKAVIGTVDVNDEFPYVVKIDFGDGGYCTGAVTVDNLITTAAHCVWDDEAKVLRNPNNIQISYLDMDGIKRTTGVTKIFIRSEYRSTKPRKQRSSSDEIQRAEIDIAILIPTESIELYEYSGWITDVLKTSLLKENTNVYESLLEALGKFSNVSTRVVGYGGFGCQKYVLNDNGDDDCKRDGKRRYAEAPLVPLVERGNATAQVPRVWCSGNGAEGVNPVRRGDSGGPFFIRTLDGRWLYVGNIAASLGGEFGCSSSLTSNIELWKQVLNSPEYRNRPGHSDDWFAKRAGHAVREFFRLMSSSPEEALPRVLSMYYGVEKSEDGKLVNVGGIDYRGETNIKNYDQKEKLIGKWPVRIFKVESVAAEASPGSRRYAPGTYHSATGYVSWSLSNPATGERKDGRTRFDFNLITFDVDANPIEAGTSRNPLIYEEDFTPTLGLVQDFQLFQNVSYDGGDYDNFKDIDLENCERLCKIDDRCLAFSYIETSRWCWIKSTVPPSSGKPRIVSGLKQSDGVRVENPKFKLFQDFSYDGGDYKNLKGIDLESCQRICNDDKNCKAFSFIEKSSWCWLKSTVPTSSAKSRITSGLKEK